MYACSDAACNAVLGGTRRPAGLASQRHATTALPFPSAFFDSIDLHLFSQRPTIRGGIIRGRAGEGRCAVYRLQVEKAVSGRGRRRHWGDSARQRAAANDQWQWTPVCMPRPHAAMRTGYLYQVPCLLMNPSELRRSRSSSPRVSFQRPRHLSISNRSPASGETNGAGQGAALAKPSMLSRLLAVAVALSTQSNAQAPDHPSPSLQASSNQRRKVRSSSFSFASTAASFSLRVGASLRSRVRGTCPLALKRRASWPSSTAASRRAGTEDD